jgi:hypothetical protein
MAFYSCPECNSSIKDDSKYCPQCGFNLAIDNKDSSVNPGYIYVLSNPAFGYQIYKIGKTTRAPSERAAELSSPTSVPEPFVIQHQQHFADCDSAENMIHGALKDYRCNSGREFFKLDLSLLIKICSGICEAINSSFKQKMVNSVIEIFDDLEKPNSSTKQKLIVA